jgi:uncharacterized membrane protein YgcG
MAFVFPIEINSLKKYASGKNSYNLKIKNKKKKNFINKVSNSLNSKSLIRNFIAINSIINLIFYPGASNALPLEKPPGKIIDEAGTLTKSSLAYIEKTVMKINETNQNDLYFVSIRNLPFDKTVSEYTQELFQKWALGPNDILVVLVNKVAKAGICYGNQVNKLSESVVKSIGEETYSYKAKDEQYSSAAIDVSNRLFSILSNKGDPGPPQINRENNDSNFKSAKNTEEQRSKYIAIIVILLIIAFVVPMVQFFFYVKDE